MSCGPPPARCSCGDYGHYSIVFGSVTPSEAASFYATALPQAGYTIISNSS